MVLEMSLVWEIAAVRSFRAVSGREESQIRIRNAIRRQFDFALQPLTPHLYLFRSADSRVQVLFCLVQTLGEGRRHRFFFLLHTYSTVRVKYTM